MSEEELIKNLRCLRMRLNPILSEQYKNVLTEAEKRLSGEVISSPTTRLKMKETKKMSKKELMEKWNAWGL
jgi:hypothetical protein